MSDVPQEPQQLETVHPAAEPKAPEPKPAEPQAAKRSIVIPVVAALAVGAVVGGVSGAGVSLWATSLNDGGSGTPAVSTPATITVNDPEDATLITAVAAKASPSVVTISVSSNSAAGTGSGVILSDDGYILTNNHVVTLDGAAASPSVTVTTSDGRLLAATIVGTDPISDLAVIKVDATGLQPAEFADSAALNVGDTVIAIGAPLGLAGTVTDGIVSALNRSITVASSALPEESDDGQDQAPGEESPYDFWGFDLPGREQAPRTQSSSTISLAVIQTDAAINPGNSGGALVDTEGRVIGINVAIATAGSGSGNASGSIGVGFAIPSNFAQRIADELIHGGKATHGLLGANVTNVTEDVNQTAPEVIGASIVELVQGGAAEAAGLRVGDIVTGLNGIPITGKNDLTAQVRALAAGADATLTYVRDGKAASVDVTLGTLQ